MAGGKRSKWMTHVKKTMKAHKGVPLSKVLKMAKKTYKGGAGVVMNGRSGDAVPIEMRGGGALSPLPLNGGRRRRGSRKTRRGARRH
jgi:hypothetical protein